MSTLSLKNKDQAETPEVKPEVKHEAKSEKSGKSISALPGGRLGPAESKRNSYTATTVGGTPFEDALQPGYWRNYTNLIKPWDIIEVRAEDGVFWALLLVVDVSPSSVVVETIFKKDLSSVKQEAIELMGCEVGWNGAVDRYRVVRKSDSRVLSKDHPSMASAVNWLTQNSRLVA